jgi:predicted CopG family antitoxin
MYNKRIKTFSDFINESVNQKRKDLVNKYISHRNITEFSKKEYNLYKEYYQSLNNIRFYWIDKDNDIYISIGETMLDPNKYMASIIGADEEDAALDSTDSELMMLDGPLKSLKEVIKKVNNEYSLSLK